MNKRIKKKHKWKDYYLKKFHQFIHKTPEETFKFVVLHRVGFVTIPKCRHSLKCKYVYKRNVKRAAKWAIENEMRNWVPTYKHHRFARHLQPKEDHNENT